MILSGDVALVTGGLRGIGAAVVRDMALAGASVVCGDLEEGDSVDLPPSLRGRVAFRRMDVRLEADWTSTVEFCEQQFGKLTILVNNAGIIAPDGDEGPITALPLKTYRHFLEVNQIGVFLGLKHGGEAIVRAGGGAIVNISSIGAILGVPHTAAYASAKAAVMALTRIAAVELGPQGVRVNSVLPGAIATPIHADGLDAVRAKARRAQLDGAVANIPLPRLAEADEVARVVTFLASKSASYVTSAQLTVDGGMTAI